MYPLGTAQDGAFAEYVKAPFEHVYILPKRIGFEEGAIIEPFACATHGLEKLSVNPGDFVVIIGAGTIGLMMLKILQFSGAGKVVVIDVSDSSLSYARKFGADFFINPQDNTSDYFIEDIHDWMMDQTNGQLADKVIVPTAAVPAFSSAIEISGKGSDIVFFGLPSPNLSLPIPIHNLLINEKTLHFSWLAPLVWPRVVQMLSTRDYRLSELITHKYSLDDLGIAIKTLENKEENIVKAIVTF
jgi:L-iditol 2-dehydrogenase